MYSKKLIVLLVALFVIACGGGARPRSVNAPAAAGGTVGETAGPSTVSEQSAAPAEYGPSDKKSAGASLDEAGPAPAPSTEARAQRPLKEREERPGLGTVWGETRASRVSTTPFMREDDAPFEVARIFYDDASGVRAMLRRNGVGSLRNDSFEIAGGALSVRLLDSSGRPLPGASSTGRHFVVGQDGERYSIQIRNNTDERFEVVASVDGLDVVDGHAGGFEKRGYVIAPFSTLEIDGFRQSFDSVAAFRFGAVDESYSARKGDARNVGVIGIAFFAETGSARPWLERPRSSEARRRLSADPFPNRFAEPPGSF
jgi:hypothetical protein